MYRSIFIALFVLTSFACQSQRAQISENTVKTDVPSLSNSQANSENKLSDDNTNELVETFTDDENIGVKGKNKIEVNNYKRADADNRNQIRNTNVAEIKFYSLDANKQWILKQKFEFDKDDILGCDPQVEDFNNDGFKDITYVSTVAARGANEVRRLFVYDKQKDEFIYIKNSEDYPNMLYNRELNCIDSMMIHGTSTTVFVKIEGDLLKEFARVGNDGSTRTVRVIGKDGQEKLLRKDKITEDEIYIRYKNFNPLKEYTDADFKQTN